MPRHPSHALRLSCMAGGTIGLAALMFYAPEVSLGWSSPDGGAHESIMREAIRLINVPFPQSYSEAIATGTNEEDRPESAFPFRHHGYNPITGATFNSPLHSDERTALEHAQFRWQDMVQRFRNTDYLSAYEYLGRASHLLQDMSQPGHTHAPRGHGNIDPSPPYWAVSDLERYWGYWSGSASGTYTPSYAIPSSPIWGSKMREADWDKMRNDYIRPSTRSDTVADYIEVMALVSYFHNAFYGRIYRDNPPLPDNSDPMSQMFLDRMEYKSWDNSWRLSGVGEYEAEFNIDDWWPEAGELGTVVFNGKDALGYFYMYTTYNEDHDISEAGTAYPDRWPNGDSNPTNKTLAQYLGEVLIPVAVRYNRGLLNLANRRLHITSSPGSTSVSLSRQDNLGNRNGSTGSSGFDRYFVSGESLTLTADATDSSGRAFEAWLRNSGHFSSGSSITITVTDAVDFTAVYVSDADGDGYSPPDDCNDNNPNVHPGATEFCNGIDDDCDEQTDEQNANGCTTYYRDSDNDGYGLRGDTRCLCSSSGVYRTTQGGDCDDTRSSINPAATESCNGRDDDCDEQTDEENASGCSTYYRDSDGDGFGVDNDTRCLCSASGSYRATQAGDCNDSNASIYPGATEVCNDQTDNDCDQQADCADTSCDTDPSCQDCGNGPCEAALGENPCNCSADCGTPPATEQPGTTCADGIDNDCDGAADGADSDCSDCGNDMCEAGIGENPCMCENDCGPPPGTEDPATTCTDGIDNDCDDLIDCSDPDCASACSGACSLGSGDCCEANGSAGCEDDTCCAAVCACDPFCCENEWDADCAIRNTIVPGCDAATLCDGRCGMFHPADLRQSWSGDCSCAMCNDWRIDECEALAYAEAWQRGAHDDMTGAMRALYTWITLLLHKVHRSECRFS